MGTTHHPRLRRLPVPRWEPPFDDEIETGGVAARVPAPDQGALALAFVLPNGMPAVPTTPSPLFPQLRLVAVPDAADDEFGPQPTPRSALPEPHGWAARLVQAVVEVLAGDRPTSQLIRWTSEEVFDEVSARVLPPAPGPARRSAGPPERGVVRSVHVTEPSDGVAEVCALVRRGLRCTALALRLEGIDGRWQCTAIELG